MKKTAIISSIQKAFRSLAKWLKGKPEVVSTRHGIHSKRPYYLKAELMDAAQAKRLRKNAKRIRPYICEQ